MKIVIDARLYGLKHRGIGRYLIELISGLAKDSSQYNFVLLINPEVKDQLLGLPKNFELVNAPWRVYGWAEQVLLPKLLYKLKPDLIHFPHFSAPFFSPRPYVITIHDLILHHAPSERASTLPSMYYWLKIFIYHLLLNRLLNKADRIITVSRAVAEDIAINYSTVKNNIIVIPLAPANLLPISKDNFSKTYGLMVGAAYPHKNLTRAIAAVAQVREIYPNLELIIAGRIDKFMKGIVDWVKTNNYDKWIFFAGELPDTELANTYAGASFYLLPSLQEGFGLGGLEALVYGVPVVASNIPVLHEVLGQAAIFIDPSSISSIVKGIKEALQPSMKEGLQVMAKVTLQNYDWSKTVQATIKVYKSSLNSYKS